MTLEEFFKLNPNAAIGFSGGVDSAYLLWAASKWARRVKGYYVKSAFQPQFELEDALKLASDIGARLQVIDVDILKAPHVAENPADRCYYCKRCIFGLVSEAAVKDGFSVLLDGTNASDDVSERPGVRALRELNVKSPLRECGLTKAKIRELSKEAGLFTWNKPAYACLATRIAEGERITEEKLKVTEKSEGYLFSLGFRDFRIRQAQGKARLQIQKEDMPKAESMKEEIFKELSKYYDSIQDKIELR